VTRRDVDGFQAGKRVEHEIGSDVNGRDVMWRVMARLGMMIMCRMMGGVLVMWQGMVVMPGNKNEAGG